MERDRIVELEIQGLRCLHAVRLPIGGLTVLVGENGAGKSSVLEALEILRRAGTEQNFLEAFHIYHGGLNELLEVGAPELRLAIGVDGPDGSLRYVLGLAASGTSTLVSTEELRTAAASTVAEHAAATSPVSGQAGDRDDRPQHPGPIILRDRSTAEVLQADTGELAAAKLKSPGRLLLTTFGDRPPHPAIGRIQRALETIAVHVPFEVRPEWVRRNNQGMLAGLRSQTMIRPGTSLTPLGSNLANAYFTLRNDHREWEETLAYVRLGLGETVEDVSIEAQPGGGYIALQVKYRGTAEPTPCAALSDGTLAYLAFVALYRLPGAGGLVAFDEPETHLHPALLGRVLDMFESMAHDRPVVLATHSDRLLDGLSDPANSTLLFELDERRRTRVLRPDAIRLEQWLAEYRGLGDVRAEGHESDVMKPAGPEPSE